MKVRMLSLKASTNGNGTTPDAIAKRVLQTLEQKQHSTPPFPLDALPEALQGIIKAWNRAYLLPVDYYATAALVAASTICGSRYRVTYKLNQHEYPTIYAAIVGAPGLGKTPAINTALSPLFRLEEQFAKEFQNDLNEWKRECHELSQLANRPPDPPRPICREIIVNDATLEALNDTLAHNPAGILYYRDELNAWLASMNQYRKGADTEFWLSNWSNTTIKINRKGRDPILIKRPFVNVIGGIQPGILHNLAADNNAHNGFLARILFAYPENQNIPPESDILPDQSVFDHYQDIYRNLYLLPDSDDGPTALHLTRRAKDVFTEFVEHIRNDANTAEEETVKSLFIKMKSYCLRFSLILHLLDLASNKPPISSNDLANTEISETTIRHAIKLCEYYTATALRVLIRFESPVNQLPEKHRALYEALPDAFRRELALETAQHLEISTSTVKRLLNNQILFKRSGPGMYEKKLL
ncbi:MAG: DUF3987 domain-containing protein [Bacteroidetes bacterium]|nr:MAG: DUF3987 domain-containing protein [Bacteroidota bacterium]